MVSIIIMSHTTCTCMRSKRSFRGLVYYRFGQLVLRYNMSNVLALYRVLLLYLYRNWDRIKSSPYMEAPFSLHGSVPLMALVLMTNLVIVHGIGNSSVRTSTFQLINAANPTNTTNVNKIYGRTDSAQHCGLRYDVLKWSNVICEVT